jgi:gas vesicle protein GvpG
MFLADDIVLFPFKGLLSIFREIHKAALEEIAGEGQAIRNELASLYRMLEQGAMTEEDFDDKERLLLDRLDAIDERDGAIELGEDEDEDFDDDDDDDEEDDTDEDGVVDSL